MSDLTDVWFIVHMLSSGTLSNIHGPYFSEHDAKEALKEWRKEKEWGAEFYILKAQV